MTFMLVVVIALDGCHSLTDDTTKMSILGVVIMVEQDSWLLAVGRIFRQAICR